ncbi:MAG: SusC/RagA family TonB-linked outer membrane protein, partial [Bacteroidia bacterium]|nr:SusC/RagA family TonB-linked outer membrane protein [Bacteroidia bacterium]
MKSKNVFRLLLVLFMAIIGIGAAQAQSITVKGIVSDAADNSPLPGVNVIVKGTTNGTITNFDGQYEIKANAGDILLFSFIGYTSVELQAQATLNVALSSDVTNLDDVVVIGYGVARKNDLTGSVTAIKPDELNKGMVTNAQDMMQGKIAGVNVTTESGAPGSGATIRVRGGSSLNASNDPLIVIDGLAMDNNGVKGLSNPLSMVNPADIESFTVLKDASATAIYGSRGSNGVIIITTKKGRAGQKLQVSYNGSFGVSVKKNLLEVMSGDEFAKYITDLYGEGSEAVANLGYAKEGETPVIYNTDWQDEIYRTAYSTDHNLTFTGSAANMPYRVSAGYTGQQGILDTSDFRRITVSANVSPKFLDEHLTVNASAKYMYSETVYANTDAIGASLRMDPTKPVYAANGDSRYDKFGGFYQWANWGKGVFNDPQWTDVNNSLAPGNPRALLDQKDDTAVSKAFIGNAEIDYKFHGFEDLRAHVNLGGDWSTGKQTTIISPYSTTNYYYGWSGYDKIDKKNLSLSATLQYSHDFDSANQHFDIMGGYEWQKFHREGEGLGSGFYQDTHVEFPGQKYNEKPTAWATENFIVSFFGRANYSLLDRYLITATVRYDGSSRFQDHWALFPSVALGWRVKEEAFLRDVDVVSDLKVRLGYGETGQQEGIGDYNYFASFHSNPNADYYYSVVGNKTGIGSMYRPNAYNPDLTWETTTTYNVGLDFGFLDQRFSGSVDLYKRKTTDLINTVSVPVGTNFKNKVTSNIGSLENNGIEIALNGKAIATDLVTWEL